MAMTEQEIKEAIKFEAASLLWNGARFSHDLRLYGTPEEMLEKCPEYIRGFVDARTETILEIVKGEGWFGGKEIF